MKKIIISFVLLLSVSLTNAQSISSELVSSAGNDYQGANLQVSWSIGEVMVSTYSANNIVLTQGFHQEKYTVFTLVEDLESNIQLKIYPNPTSDYLSLEVIDFKELDQLSIKLFDFNGKLLLAKKVEQNKEIIDMSNFANATYILKVYSNKKDLNSYKVSKIY